MSKTSQEKRKYQRISPEDKLGFDFVYNLITRMKFLREIERESISLDSGHPGFVKNVSIEGLCFVSEQSLLQGEKIDIEVFIPSLNKPVFMEGEVKWAKESGLTVCEKDDVFDSAKSLEKVLNRKFDAGVLLEKVEGKGVHETIYFDEEYKLTWSIVLESIVGGYRVYIHKKRKND